ncbi:P-loop containing nucleoside triphosphate hydrolase protein [Lipomyces japonicus]|uniref:P-loop containing nucleoside triphosphate hydrolase protein n=1 Tax=Lipomyces japonicus TaxID=56871 RepID=UPI0034CDC162
MTSSTTTHEVSSHDDNEDLDKQLDVKTMSTQSAESASGPLKSASKLSTVLRWLNLVARQNPPSVPEVAPITNEIKANFVSKLYFNWMTPLMVTGYARPLEINDIPIIDDNRTAKIMTDKFLANLKARQEPGKHSHNLVLRAMNDTFFSIFGICLLAGRKVIYFVADWYAGQESGVGKGVGLVIGLVVMLFVSGITQQQYFYYSNKAGSHTCTVLINALYRKSLVLSNKSRLEFSNGKITNLMSTDTFRIEFASNFFHHLTDAPVPLILCIVLLLVNIGVSALCGITILFLVRPAIAVITKTIGKRRFKSVVFTDARIRLMQELLSTMRVIKFFAWELSYFSRLKEIRYKEIRLVRVLLVLQSAIYAISLTVPIFASMISFVVLSLTGAKLEPAKVFASLALFNMLRVPLMLLPQAFWRIEKMLFAEELAGVTEPDLLLHDAIEVVNASFEWEQDEPDDDDDDDDSHIRGEKDTKATSKRKLRWLNKKVKEEKENALSRAISIESANVTSSVINEIELDTVIEKLEEGVTGSNADEPHATEVSGLRNINLTIKRGELVVVTGFIGSDKTSLLASLVGEMRQTAGQVKIGGKVAYCPTPWIQNATLRDNILFGREFDADRYDAVVEACALEHDIKVLTGGDSTEIGERGINISGGQKSRISLAHASYYDSDIVILDDVLSAVDLHVGKLLVDNCICGLLSDWTRLLATHQLHVLPRADWIIFMDGHGGLTIGTYDELLISCPKFAELTTHSLAASNDDKNDNDNDDDNGDDGNQKGGSDKISVVPAGGKTGEKPGNGGGKLIKAEERNRDGVALDVYMTYFRAAGGKYLSWTIPPLILLFTIVASGCQILTNLWLSYWTQDKFHETKGFYIGLFVGLGIITAILMFVFGWITTYAGSNASVKMNMQGGRQGVNGIFMLIVAYFYWFAIALVVLLVFYVLVIAYYRASAVELKRMDSIARSNVFSHFSESLTGLTSIRAYNEQSRFVNHMERSLDYMNRFSYVILANQRWLSCRLETVAILMTTVAGLVAVCGVFSVSPSPIGLVLSYCMALSMQMAMVIKQLAEMENNMNAVERVQYYIDQVPSEAAFRADSSVAPAPEWPTAGSVKLDNVFLKYWPELPYVLNGISLDIKGGEKIGICGRTAEYGHDLDRRRGHSTIGLHDLRTKLAIIHQDPVLFNGTIRSNLDPFGTYADADLWDALRRAGLNAPDGKAELQQQQQYKFRLDQEVEDEGLNFSLGERQLLSRARALMRQFRILVLDEATSSVDYQTDARVQAVIGHEFGHCTILCIAHRLKTISL